MEDERTYSKSEIRERRRELSQLVALQQRQLAALAKMDEAADELDQVEREMAALASGGTQSEQPADAVPAEPEMTGERAVAVMRDDHPNVWCDARGIIGDFTARGWIGDKDPDLVLQSLRHSLRRLALHNPHVERRIEGSKHYYRYVTHSNGEAPVKISDVAVSRVSGRVES
jgi:hypothetical protein